MKVRSDRSAMHNNFQSTISTFLVFPIIIIWMPRVLWQSHPSTTRLTCINRDVECPSLRYVVRIQSWCNTFCCSNLRQLFLSNCKAKKFSTALSPLVFIASLLPLVLCLAEEITLSLLLFLLNCILSRCFLTVTRQLCCWQQLVMSTTTVFAQIAIKNSLGFPKLNWRQTVGYVRLHAYACAIYR